MAWPRLLAMAPAPRCTLSECKQAAGCVVCSSQGCCRAGLKVLLLPARHRWPGGVHCIRKAHEPCARRPGHLRPASTAATCSRQPCSPGRSGTQPSMACIAQAEADRLSEEALLPDAFLQATPCSGSSTLLQAGAPQQAAHPRLLRRLLSSPGTCWHAARQACTSLSASAGCWPGAAAAVHSRTRWAVPSSSRAPLSVQGSAQHCRTAASAAYVNGTWLPGCAADTAPSRRRSACAARGRCQMPGRERQGRCAVWRTGRQQAATAWHAEAAPAAHPCLPRRSGLC